LHQIKFKTALFILFSFSLYILSMLLMKNFFSINIFDLYTIRKILTLYLIAFIPILLFKIVIKLCWPNAFRRVRAVQIN